MANWKLFGFQITNEKTKDKEGQTDNLINKEKSFALPQNDDGAVTLQTGAYFGTYVDLEGVVRNEIELITRYREMAMQPELETAIDDIVNEAIVMQGHGLPLDINLDELRVPDTIKKKIREEFRHILKLLNFGNMGSELFRRWYIDGRMFYHVIIDETQPRQGVKELRYIDPRRIRKVREIQKTKDAATGADIIKTMNEYFLYNERGIIGAHSNLGMRIAPDSILNVNSGLMDSRRAMVLSYLHKAIKPLNQLRMVEDATVIYRLSRAPERRVFYIDVGNLPKVKAEQYLRDLMVKYRNKLVYDSCFSMDTLIPLLDGRKLTITEMQKEFEQGKQLWVYSCDPVTGKLAPGLVSSAGVTKFDQKVMKLTLDNGKTITCTLDHKFPVWGKGKVEAKDLIIGDSMIPHYTKMKSIGGNGNSKYEQVYDNDLKKWIYTHRMVSAWKDENNIPNEYVYNEDRKEENKLTVHHKNYNRHDNTPENLVRMSRNDHFDYHKQHCSDAGKLGGKVSAQKKKEYGIPYFTSRPSKEVLLESGKKLAAMKLGFQAWTSEQRQQHNIANNKKVVDKLREDPEFNKKFRESLRNGWSEEEKKLASERGKNLPKSHFKKMSKKANLSRWSGENGEINKQLLSKKQSIIYTKEIVDFIVANTEKTTKVKQLIDTFMESALYNEWLLINEKQTIKNWNKKFTTKNINSICKILGFDKWSDFKNSIALRNHKITKIEFLKETMDVGTLGIDKNEKYHNYHTFALDAGIFTYNSTGEIRDDRKHLSMLEDFWLPRREGGKGTEIQTLPGGQNLGEMEDVKYFERKLYKSLGIPISRLEQQQGFSLGRTTEITRDELKFSKFVFRLRNKFSTLFDEALRIQLSLKGICTIEEWNDFKESIYYDFITDNNFEELKKAELIQNRITVLQLADPYIGKYFSMQWARKNILNQNDDEIEEIKKQIEDEQEEMQQMAQKTAELTAIQSGAMMQQDQQQQQPQPQPQPTANPLQPQPDQAEPQVDVNTAFQNTTNPGVNQLDDTVNKNLKVENKSNINSILRIIKDRREVL